MRLRCFFDFVTDTDGNKLCTGKITPTAVRNPTHGYCALHREAEIERAQWDADLSTSQRAGRYKLGQSKLNVEIRKRRAA